MARLRDGRGATDQSRGLFCRTPIEVTHLPAGHPRRSAAKRNIERGPRWVGALKLHGVPDLHCATLRLSGMTGLCSGLRQPVRTRMKHKGMAGGEGIDIG
jgi:hypothetical protein